MATIKEKIEDHPSGSSHASEEPSLDLEITVSTVDSEKDKADDAPASKDEAEVSPKASSSESAEESDEDESDVPPIVDSVSQQQIDEFKPFHERYFTKRYLTKFSTDSVNLDTCIRVHTNKIYLVYLSEKHTIIKNQQRISFLNYQVSKKVNRSRNMFSGKNKKGAQMIQPDSILCHIQTRDGSSYPVHGGVFGKLLEVNKRLEDNPNLLIDDLNVGFLAIILPDLRKHEDNLKGLISNEEYNNS